MLSRRTTKQRQLIRDILEHADGHLDAGVIYRQAVKKSPRISLATIYRNLKMLKEIGSVEEHQFVNRRYYEPAAQAKHHHLICLGCGQVFEFKCPSTEKLKYIISKEEGFKVTDAEVRLSGYCPECQNNLNKETAKNKQYLAKRR